jgi:pyoverdine/dityrosine biosynthesis protein Dit1
MELKKRYKIGVVAAFLSIFFLKMIISVAPVFINQFDRQTMNDVIMQVELEHGADTDTAKNIKVTDIKLIEHHTTDHYVAFRYHLQVKNSYIEHIKRYVNPYHPLVPTPPPNLV